MTDWNEYAYSNEWIMSWSLLSHVFHVHKLKNGRNYVIDKNYIV